MKPYEWMVECTPQTLWIEKKGLLVWLAEVSGALGGGLYLVSLYLDSLGGMFLGWLIIATLKPAFHFAHLGQPMRFWRLALKPGSSWLARGFIALFLFIIFGAVQIALSFWLPGTAWASALKVAGGIFAFLVIAYAGFLMNYVRGIPLWNSGLLPLIFVSFGLSGGMALILLMGVSGFNVDVKTTLAGLRWLTVINAFLVITYLWSAAYASPTGRYSVQKLTEGRDAPMLWLGVFLCGLVIPFGIFFYDYFSGQTSEALRTIASSCVLAGVFSLNYCLLKGAYYSPLISTN